MASGKEAAPMRLLRVGLLGLAAISIWSVADAQQIQINKENKTIAITTSGDAEALADTAVLTVGFHIYGKDQDGTYADASKASNAIMAALKSAGVANERIESTEQSLSPLGVNDEADKLRFGQGSRFEFSQSWSVTLPAAAVANVLHVAITAGANDSGVDPMAVGERRRAGGRGGEESAGTCQADCCPDGGGTGCEAGCAGLCEQPDAPERLRRSVGDEWGDIADRIGRDRGKGKEFSPAGDFAGADYEVCDGVRGVCDRMKAAVPLVLKANTEILVPHERDQNDGGVRVCRLAGCL
jgi:hypothetical protein